MTGAAVMAQALSSEVTTQGSGDSLKIAQPTAILTGTMVICVSWARFLSVLSFTRGSRSWPMTR
jgi:hypothetical protein